MNTAEKIIKKFGGQSALAKLIDKTQPTVFHWAKVGRIPAKWQGTLLRLARERNIDVSSQDFMASGDVLTISPGDVQSNIPEARWAGELDLHGSKLPCYVLENGQRVISRASVTYALSEKKGGDLESYIGVKALQTYMPPDIGLKMIEFIIPGVVNKTVKGIEAETFLEICKAYVVARNAGSSSETFDLSPTQEKIAIKASMFLSACSKVGLLALIDEATGYQYDRAQDALQVKLKLFLEEEMREWEKTFPDELWKEFGRLTNWNGSLHSRPKYWGKLVMELIYGYLDPDVAGWLKNNAPEPRAGRNYHQWLTSQYGLKKLVEHLWMVIGMARVCNSMSELRQKIAEQFGREAIQLTMYLPPPFSSPPRLDVPPGKKGKKKKS